MNLLDTDDIEVLTTWGIRAVAGALGILGTAITLGLAYRLFDVIKG